MVFCSLFSIIFAPEFGRDGSVEECSAIYTRVIGGFRYIDLVILVLALCHGLCLACFSKHRVTFPRVLLFPGVAFFVCIAIAILYGSAHGGSNFFFDWRALALGVALYFVWSAWMRTSKEVASAIRVFAIYLAARIVLLYLLYAVGHRDALLGVSIPTFDGPAISCIVFAGLMSFSFAEGTHDFRARLLWASLAASAYLMVLLCMRRTYWGELAIGTGILLVLQTRHRMRSLTVLAALALLAALLLGTSFSDRLQSLDVSRSDTQFSADNADHVYDLMDAWDQIRESPLMGIGLGTSYPTWHIRKWKPESVMVHNAVLHVWLKYGLAGLGCYLWFQIILLAWLYRQSRSLPSANGMFLAAAFAYLTAKFLTTLAFAPWSFSELQLTTLISFIVAAALAISSGSGAQAGNAPTYALCRHAVL